MSLNGSKVPAPKWKPTALDWIRYSGASVAVTVNPLHWRWLPVMTTRILDEWKGPHERQLKMAWLMITIRIWIDDGAW